MPKVERRHDLEGEKYPYAIEYKCTCGKPLVFLGQERPDRLEKCFDCNTYAIGEIE